MRVSVVGLLFIILILSSSLLQLLKGFHWLHVLQKDAHHVQLEAPNLAEGDRLSNSRELDPELPVELLLPLVSAHVRKDAHSVGG